MAAERAGEGIDECLRDDDGERINAGDPGGVGRPYPRSMDLTGRTALVTGANRGIGRAVTRALADRRLKLVLAGVRDPDAFEPVTGGAEVRPVRMDLSGRAAIDEC